MGEGLPFTGYIWEVTVLITIDDRECQEHPELQTISDIWEIPVTIQRLDAADYCFLDRDNEPVGIERCEIGNLVQKLASGELENQLERCQDNYQHIFLLVEGVYDKVEELLAVHKGSGRGYFRMRVFPHTRYDYVKALEIRLQELGIEYIDTPNFDCSLTTIRTIYNQRTKPEEEHTLFKKSRVPKIPTRYTNNPAVPRLMALIPRLSEKTAILLIHQFGSIWGIIHAEESQILEVEGVGKGTLQKLKENVGKPEVIT